MTATKYQISKLGKMSRPATRAHCGKVSSGRVVARRAARIDH